MAQRKFEQRKFKMKKRIWINSILGGLAVCASVSANTGVAAKQYSITGEITNTTPDSVTVKQGVEEFQFSKKDLSADSAEKMKKGDKVTIFYSMDAKRVTTAQEAGEARPGEVPPGKQHIIEDDRVFQTAGLNSEASGVNANHGSQQPASSSNQNGNQNGDAPNK
jgi:hypothetical protein